MKRAGKVGIGVAALAVAGLVAVRFGGSQAAKTGLDQVLANLPPGWTATHGPVTYNALAGAAEVEGLVITHDGQRFLAATSLTATGIHGMTATSWPTLIDKVVIKDLSGTTYRHVAHVDIEGLHLVNLVSVFDVGSYPHGKPSSTAPLKLLASLDASDAQVHIELPPQAGNGPKIGALDLHAGHFHSDGLSARQFSRAPTDGAFQDPVFVADVARAVAQDNAAIKDLTDSAPGVGSAHIDSATASDIRGGRLGAIDERGITFAADGKPDRFSVDRIGVQDVDLNKLLDSLVERARAGGAGKLNSAIKVGKYSLDGVTADFEKSPLFSLASLDGQTHYADDGGQDGTLSLRGLKIVTTGRDIKPAAQLALDRFGMADFTIDFDEAAKYTPADGHLRLTRAEMQLHDLGTLHMVLDATGLQNLSNLATDRPETLQAIKLINASLTWDDTSLTGRVFKMLAAQSGKSVDELHAALALPVASLAIFLPNQPDAPAQVSAFLADPKQLTITLAPPDPVSLYDVAKASAQQKAALLGVTVKGD
jgi:hypothetical protein